MNAYIYDCEVTAFDFLVVFYDVENDEYTAIWNDNAKIKEYIANKKSDIFVGFNNKSYDYFIIRGIVGGLEPYKVKHINDFIIGGNRGWDSPDLPKIKLEMNNVDLMDDTQQGLSLKSFEAQMGWDIVESSIDFNIDRPLTEEEKEEMQSYCINDVKATYELYKIRKSYLETKADIADMIDYPIEKALCLTNAKLTALYLNAEQREWGDEWEYTFPENLRREYIPDEAIAYFENVMKCEGEGVENLNLTIAGCPITLGLGGIHGAIPKCKCENKRNFLIWNLDVASYYPHLMTINGYVSRNIKNPDDFKNVLIKRLAAKKIGNKKASNALKLILNTTYGAMLNQYNDLYDPKNGRSVCISGQLYLLSLAVQLSQEIPKLSIIQVNTDGIMVTFPKAHADRVEAISKGWQANTQFTLEKDDIQTIIQKDVNNYIAIRTDGKVKGKGGYLVRGISEAGAFSINNNMRIVSEAIIDYFVKGIPVEQTIRECKEIKQFQIIAKASHKFSKVLWWRCNEWHEVQRVNRIYASKLTIEGGLVKIHKDTNAQYKIADLPDYCRIDNTGKNTTINNIDLDYYIQVAKKRVNDFYEEKELMLPMATTETKETKPKAKNAFQRLTEARLEVAETQFVKTGKNTMGKGYPYFKLEDIMPKITKIAHRNGLLNIVYFTEETVNLDVVNIDNPDDKFTFSVPLVVFAGNNGTNIVQGMGATITYYRKYMYELAYDICEEDEIDGNYNLNSDLPTTQSKAPATPVERAEIKANLTSGKATQIQLKQLSDAFARIIELNPDLRGEIQKLIAANNQFADTTKEQAETLLKQAAETISQLENSNIPF